MSLQTETRLVGEDAGPVEFSHHTFKSTTKLKALDLSQYPYDEINELTNYFGGVAFVQKHLHPGKIIVRARLNKPTETFTHRSEVSYLPADKNNKYQRASTPSQTMFYGGTIHESILEGELNNQRVIATLEATELLRSHWLDGEYKITYSNWMVVQDINLLAICYHQDFTTHNSHTKELYEAYYRYVATLPDDVKNKSIFVTEYLAGEFAKKEINDDYDYMISAIFTEKSLSHNQGIYYPSVRVDGDGFNVAIHPSIVDSSLKLIVVGECTIYKKGTNIYVDNDTVCQIDDDSKPFTLMPVESQYHLGKDEIMKRLSK